MMALVAFSSVAVAWDRVFAAESNPAADKVPASVTLHVEGAGGEALEIILPQKDGVEAIERMKSERERFRAVGQLYADMSRVFRIWLPPDEGEAATITFALPKSHNYVITIRRGLARVLLDELRRESPRT